MSAGEIAGRCGDAVRKRAWRKRRVRDARADPLEVPRDGIAFERGFGPPVGMAGKVGDVGMAGDVGNAGDVGRSDAAKALIEAAESVLAGRWTALGCTWEGLGPDPDWFLDPGRGRRADDEACAFDIDIRHARDGARPKHAWELSRQGHLTVLASAYHLTGDVRYAERIAAQLTSWWTRNPFLTGMQWTSGIEIGLRLIAWVWIRRLLDGWEGCRELFEGNRLFLQQFHHHQEYLATFPSRGSSANNHALAEAAGLLVASSALPCFDASAGWRAAAAVTLRRELPRQTLASGVNAELATEYQGFVLEVALVSGLEGEAAGESLGEEFWTATRALCDGLAALVDIRGEPPRQGDADDAFALLVDAPSFHRWASLLATGRALFGACAWWPATPPADLRTALLARLASAPTLSASRPECRPQVFEDAGLCILRSSLPSGAEVWCRGDFGPHGLPTTYGHAHADALALEFRVDGVDVLVDPGTFAYQGEPAWRDYFRSTRGHNTLELAGQDQSVSGGEFLWTTPAVTTLIALEPAEAGALRGWTARHDGYARLIPPAIHQRTVRLEGGVLTIDDGVESTGRHACRLCFHLGPQVECRLEGARAVLHWTSSGAAWTAELALPEVLAWRAVKGEVDPPLGWYSPSFGVRVPSTTLVGAGHAGAGPLLRTRLTITPAAAAGPQV